MKKFLKFMTVVCMLVLMCGVAVSADETPITADVVKSGTENPAAFAKHSYTYGQTDTFVIGTNPFYGKIIPITISEPGRLYLSFDENQSLSTTAQIGILSNRNSTSGQFSTYSSTDYLKNKLIYANISTAGTYYIILNSSQYYSSLTSNTITFSTYVVGSSFGTVEQSVTNRNTTITYYTGNYSSSAPDLYIKYKAPANGYLTLTANSGSGYVTLCNAKKKALSTKDTIHSEYTNNKSVYGVKKGTTYYVKVNSYENTFALNLKTTAISEKSGASKKKAKTMAVNKNVKGTIVAGTKTADWYKIVLTKSSRVTINVKSSSNGNLKISVYKGSSSYGSGSMSGINYSNQFISVNKYNTSQRVRWTKGTYYVKVERGNSTSSGYYTLKWQKK